MELDGVDLTEDTDDIGAKESISDSSTDDKIHEPIPKPKRISLMPLLASIVFAISYASPILEDRPKEHSCLAVLITSCFLWVSEAVPSYVTSLLIVFAAVVLELGVEEEGAIVMSKGKIVHLMAHQFSEPVILMFLGSLVISEGLTKLDITTKLSRVFLKVVPKSSHGILLSLMLANVITSSILSNVTSTTLILSITLPILKSFSPRDSMIKAFLLGIAWSGNCGGMTTTIASPQNMLAAKATGISFTRWLTFAGPVSCTLCIIFWGLLVIRLGRGVDTIPVEPRLSSNEQPWGFRQTASVLVVLLTIGLWSMGEHIECLFGHAGIVAIFPIAWFYGTGILTSSDFNSGKWTTLILIGGGLALGEVMKLSGLLDFISEESRPLLADIPENMVLIAIIAFVSVFSSLMSSATAAAIINPIIIAISPTKEVSNYTILLSTLMVSGAQLFHISSFPNALVSSVTYRQMGHHFVGSDQTVLSGSDFVVHGWITVAIGAIVILSLGRALLFSLE